RGVHHTDAVRRASRAEVAGNTFTRLYGDDIKLRDTRPRTLCRILVHRGHLAPRASRQGHHQEERPKVNICFVHGIVLFRLHGLHTTHVQYSIADSECSDEIPYGADYRRIFHSKAPVPLDAPITI